MRKLALIGATVVGALVLSACPISVNWSAGRQLLCVARQGICCGWQTPYARKCSRGAPKARPARGEALRGGRYLPLGSPHHAAKRLNGLGRRYALASVPLSCAAPSEPSRRRRETTRFQRDDRLGRSRH